MPACKHVLNGLLHHIRWWWGDDALDLHLCRSGLMDGPRFRKFATRYKVGRTLRKGLEAEALHIVQTRLATGWPDELQDRAHVADELVNTLQSKGITSRPSASLVSKAIWFFRPHGWTLYDRFAADGLQIKKHGQTTQKRMQLYYQKLYGIGFGNLVDTMRHQNQSSLFPNIWPERVVDGCLLSKGSMFETWSMDMIKTVFGSRYSAAIAELSSQMTDTIYKFPEWKKALQA